MYACAQRHEVKAYSVYEGEARMLTEKMMQKIET